jgi:hypothetical protein
MGIQSRLGLIVIMLIVISGRLAFASITGVKMTALCESPEKSGDFTPEYKLVDFTIFGKSRVQTLTRFSDQNTSIALFSPVKEGDIMELKHLDQSDFELTIKSESFEYDEIYQNEKTARNFVAEIKLNYGKKFELKCVQKLHKR